MRGAAAVFPLSPPTAPSPPSPPALLQRAAASGAAAAARRSRPHLRSKHCGVACSCRQSGGDHGESPRRTPAAPQEVLLRAVAGAAISFSLFSYSLPSPPAAVALDAEATAAVQVPSPSAQARNCNAEEELDVASEASEPSVVANEDIVEEAWEIVNESFLDAGNHGWSPEKWLQKKMDIFRSTIPTRSRAHDIIKKMLASLGDPYTRFLTPAEGDEILSVNGVDIKGKSAFEVSSLLQGPKETFVTVQVRHGDCGPVHSITVERQSVARTPVFYRLEKMENGAASIGYIRLKEFNALAKKDLAIAMKRLQDADASWFVLDLRDNRGGLVQAGIEIANLFLDQGQTVIYTVGRDPQVQRHIVAETAPVFTVPVIILVNSQTASASEIVAAALHDHCKAVLVGERTYGKGLIQSVFELHDESGVVVTVGKYVTPNHMDIDGNGIEPDFPQIPALSKITQHISECQLSGKA